MTLGIDAYPLAWPEGWKRTDPHRRSSSAYKVSFGKARDDVVHSLRLMHVRDCNVVVSSNIPVRLDGLPYANMREPSDPGIAVYWSDRSNNRRVVACDAWRTTRENLRAIGMTLEALRTLERTKASEILARAFVGFAALPPSSAAEPDWREVLGLRGSFSQDNVDAAYRELVFKAHPDRGGDHDAMVRLNRARTDALKFLGLG